MMDAHLEMGYEDGVSGSDDFYYLPCDGSPECDCETCREAWAEEVHDHVDCPACDGPGEELGCMGDRLHFRCRDCGAVFSQEVTS